MSKPMSHVNVKLYVTIVMLSLLCVANSAAQKKELGEAEAIKLAEQFIAQNGYTDLPPDRSKLAYETIQWESNVDKMLKGRHDTLERKAYGIVRGRKGGAPGWTVVFRYRHPSNQQMRRNGRAVTMNLDGSEMRVEHVGFILKYVEKKL